MYIGERLKEIQVEWEAELKSNIAYFYVQYKQWPQLSIVLATDDKASLSYVKAKMNKLQSLGISIAVYCLPNDCDFSYAENQVRDIVKRSLAVIIQSPTHFTPQETQALMNLVPYTKDADRLSYEAFGHFIDAINPSEYPATVTGIHRIVSSIFSERNLAGLRAVVFGRGQLVGTPVAMMLRDQFDMSVTEFHSMSNENDIRDICYSADVIVSASNSYLTCLENQEFKKDQVLIIDAATIVSKSGKIVGSIPESVAHLSNTLVTPVPGGVGPFTVTGLADNTAYLAFKRYMEN